MRLQADELMGPSPTKGDPAAAERTAGRASRKKCVLVVDAEHLVRVMVCLGLERYGFDVVLASNAEQAIDLYREHRGSIDVALLDFRLPDRNGLQILNALREQNPEIPVCFMSADLDDRNSSDLVEHGGVSFIAKPFLLKDLANILRLLAQ